MNQITKDLITATILLIIVWIGFEIWKRLIQKRTIKRIKGCE